MSLLNSLSDLFFPPKCVFCHKLLYEEDGSVCAECRETIRILDFPECVIPDIEGVDIAIAPLYYEGDVRKSLHRFKFYGNSFYASTYADIICKAFNRGELDCDIVTWIPLAKKRLKKRGYDQAGLIAQEISKRIAVPCFRTVKKVKNVRPQSSLKMASDRADNIKNAYVLSSSVPLAGKRILLVDDIITTGSTVREAALVLRKAGVSRITAAALTKSKK